MEQREVDVIKWIFPILIFYYIGIKLTQELIDKTQDEVDLQFLGQCVSHRRKDIGHTKEDYEKLTSI